MRLFEHVSGNQFKLVEKMSVQDAESIFSKFGVPDASQLSSDDLKRSWAKLATKHHPDAGGNDETMRTINAAYDMLKTVVVDSDRKSGVEIDQNFHDMERERRNAKYEEFVWVPEIKFSEETGFVPMWLPPSGNVGGMERKGGYDFEDAQEVLKDLRWNASNILKHRFGIDIQSIAKENMAKYGWGFKTRISTIGNKYGIHWKMVWEPAWAGNFKSDFDREVTT